MPRKVDHAQQRSRIIDATCRVLAREGLDGLSMREIAAQADCTTGLVTHYFSSKRELVGAALDHVTTVHEQRARAQLAAYPSDPATALAELLPLDDRRASELRVWLGFYAAAVTDPRLRDQHAQIYANWRAVLTEGLADAGVPAGDRRDQLVDHLVVALNGLVTQALLDAGYWTPDRQRRQLGYLVADALASAHHRP